MTTHSANIRIAHRSRIENEDLTRKPGQALDPAGAAVEEHEILDPHPGLALEVDPGLDREHRRRRQRAVEGPRAERRRLVRLKPDPVAEAMAIGRPPAVG